MTLQLRELLIAYGLTAGAMLAGLLLMRADRRAYWRWPVYSAMVMALGVVLWNLVRKHLLPAHADRAHPTAVYYGALSVYVLLGFAVGSLLGRLTRRNTPAEQEPQREPP
ncbi:MAG TPA: hypothetical protein VFL16_10525 [Steroidobacteraceae bacterium]|nr:hypothetical protein [Steroidobacteraceae bacterium]